MFHTIEFLVDVTADVEIGRKKPLERVQIEKGTRLQAQLKPYVVEAADGPVEVADFFFEDRSAIRMVPFAFFRFVEVDEPAEQKE